MPFNGPNPLLQDLDDEIAALQDAIQTFESSIWIAPSVGSGPQTIKWDLIATTYATGTTVEGSAVALTTGVAANIAVVSLPPGKWEVFPFGILKPTSGSPIVEYFSMSLNDTSGVMGGIGVIATQLINAEMTQYPAQAGPMRFFDYSAEIAAKNVFMVAKAAWSGGGTVSGFGSIRARRVP